VDHRQGRSRGRKQRAPLNWVKNPADGVMGTARGSFPPRAPLCFPPQTPTASCPPWLSFHSSLSPPNYSTGSGTTPERQSRTGSNFKCFEKYIQQQKRKVDDRAARIRSSCQLFFLHTHTAKRAPLPFRL